MNILPLGQFSTSLTYRKDKLLMCSNRNGKPDIGSRNVTCAFQTYKQLTTGSLSYVVVDGLGSLRWMMSETMVRIILVRHFSKLLPTGRW